MSYIEQRAITTICLGANGSRPPGSGVSPRPIWEQFRDSETSDTERNTILFALLLDVLRRISYFHLGSFEVAYESARQGFSARSVHADMIRKHEADIDSAGTDWNAIVETLVSILETDLRTEDNERRREELLRQFA